LSIAQTDNILLHVIMSFP